MPGATITAIQGTKNFVVISNQDGSYSFADLPDGTWKIKIAMTDFATIEQVVTVSPGMPVIKWELKLLPMPQIIAHAKVMKAGAITSVTAAAPQAQAKPQTSKASPTVEMPKPSQESSQQAADGFLVNGSVNNAATSQFTLAQAFGNTRKGVGGLYTGGLALIFDNSALDARPFSLSGLNSPKASYNRITGVITLGGPIDIPHILPRGPNFFVAYQWTRDNTAAVDPGLVPTAAERGGDLAAGIIGPIDPVAKALLKLYPIPNIAGNSEYNYQIPILNRTHEDAVQSRFDKNISRRDDVYGDFAFQSSRANSTNLFGFLDTTDTLGINSKVNWEHRLSHEIYLNTGFQFSRLRTLVVPYFANRANVSLQDGITGNDQDEPDWGPPTLVFSSGIASLSDGNSSFDRNRTDGVSASAQYYRGRHNITIGGDFRRQEFNYYSQQNPRGTFTFTGAATGVSDLADFLTGIPDTSAIAFGNADKYFRQSVSDAYANDDWRIRPELTINAGIRWEYGAPITELFGRLVNLDVATGFTDVRPVIGSNPKGSLTGENYPTSLIRPDRLGIEPRIGLSWRPIPGSSVVVRAGYGIYDDTSVYQNTALQMAQQASLPRTTSLSVQTSLACPETLASGFNPCSAITADTFAVDPNFRVGYAQTWQLSVQRDLPASLQLTASYLGIKGTRGVQQFLPNTYPIGAGSPCPQCPSGFVYQASGGDSTREAGSIQLRRRLRAGFTANLQYTYSKAIDDDSTLGGQGPVAAGAVASTPPTATIAQNWLNLRAERSLSAFDQRHLLNVQVQYTTGMGLDGGTLFGGWRGTVLKEWTASMVITAGSGLPETPIYLAAVSGTGVTGSIRPDRAAASIDSGSSGHFLNPSAYAPPQPGQWGSAGRNSIVGPGQFSLNATLARTFRVEKRYNLDMKAEATNLLNHVVYSSWNTNLNPITNPGSNAVFTTDLNPLFGLPAAANAMRSIQVTARLRF